jgi:hypothetical protein
MRWPLVCVILASATASATPPKVRNAVLLFMPATHDAPGRDPARRQFQPLLCVIDGAVVTGVRCAKLLPSRAKIRIPGNAELTVTRATSFEHPDDFPTADFPTPYAPACCNYKGCQGKTIQYDVVRADHAPALDDDPMIAVWPPDADIGLQAPKAASIPDQVLSTTDIDHDGHRERVIYQPDANNYGLVIVLDDSDASPIYQFSCADG